MFDQKTKPGPLGTDRQCVHACRSVRAHISETLFRFLFLPSFEDIQQCIAAFLSILFIGFCRVHWQLQSNLSRCNDHKTLCCFLAIGNNAAFREVLGFASQHQLQCSRKSSQKQNSLLSITLAIFLSLFVIGQGRYIGKTVMRANSERTSAANRVRTSPISCISLKKGTCSVFTRIAK